MTKPKIIIVIPCWGRAKVVEAVCSYLDHFYDQVRHQIDLKVVYVFSNEDPHIDDLKSIYYFLKHPKDLVYSSNSLLGKKLNDGIAYARRFHYDYIMNFGSDDLLHPSVIDMYMPFIKARVPVFGLNKLYFWQSQGNPVFFEYYNEPFVVGAGRMIHKRVIDDVVKHYGELYRPDLKRGMDTFSALRIQAVGYPQITIDPGRFPMLIDIKSDVNINSFEKITNSGLNVHKCTLFEKDVLKHEFSVLNHI